MMKLSTSLQTYTDLCLFYSAVQCTVLPARSYREMDMHFLTVGRERVAAVVFSVCSTLFGLLRHNPLCWRFLMCLFIWCLLLRFFFFFFGKATPSLQKNKIKSVWFHNDLCSRNEKEEETQQSRGGKKCRLIKSDQTEQHKLLLSLLFFLNNSFCNP